MSDVGSRPRGVKNKIAVAAVPVALVGLLSLLPYANTTRGADVAARPAAAGTSLVSQDGNVSDTTVPVVYFTTATLAPKEASPTAPPALTVRVTDAVGVAGCTVAFEHATTEQRLYVEATLAEGGSATDGTWTATMPVDADTPTGKWVVAEIDAYDGAGNHNYVENAREELFGDGADLSHLDFTVAGKPGADTQAPSIVLSDTSVSPKVASRATPPTFSVRATDDMGVESCVLYYMHVATEEFDSVELSLTSGTAKDGTWTAAMPVTADTPTGDWMVTAIGAFDAAGNYGLVYDGRDDPWDLDADDLSALDYRIVEAAADTASPQIHFTAATITPKEATEDAPPALSVRVTDDVGVAGCTVAFEHVTSGKHVSVKATLAEGGTAKDGTWTATMPVTADTPTGAWMVEGIVASDAAGNYGSVEDAREDPLGEGVDLSHLDFTVAGEAGDTKAPTIVLSDTSVSPKVGSVSAPPTFSVRVTDEVGVTSCMLIYMHLDTEDFDTVELTLTSGTATDGTWTAAMPVTADTPTGDWMVTAIGAFDAAGNYGLVYDGRDEPLDFDADDLSALDYQIVQASGDELPPVVFFLDATVSPKEATQARPPTFTVRITDAVGVAGCTFWCEHVASEEVALVDVELDSGTATDGTWTATLPVTADTPAGEWRVQAIVAYDEAGNYNYVLDSREEPYGDGSDLSHLDFTVTGEAGSDTQAPTIVLSDTSVSPKVGSVSAPPTFSVRATDDVGVESCVLFYMHVATEDFDSVELTLTSGTAKDGTWTAAMPVGTDTLSGDWMVTAIGAFDVAGNYGLVYDGRDEPWDADADDLSALDFELVETPAKRDITTLDVRLADSQGGTYVFEPGGVTPRVTVRDGQSQLAEGTDFEVTYADNGQVGLALAIVTGTGDYEGTAYRNFAILPADLEEVASFGPIEDQVIGSKAVCPQVTLTHGETPLVEGSDYTLSYHDNDGPGTATVTAVGRGNYTGRASTTFEVLAGPGLADADVAVSPTSYVFDARPHTPDVTVTLDGRPLEEYVDYAISGGGVTDVGTYDLHVRGIGAYEGQTRTETFTIARADVSQARVVVGEYPYQGVPVEPVPTVLLDGCLLEEGRDYTLAYADNTAPGTGHLIITGRGNLEGTATHDFTITDGRDASDIAEADVRLSPDTFVWDGRAHTCAVEVRHEGRVLSEGVDYRVEYLDNVDAGTALAVVYGQGAYHGLVAKGFEIVRRSVSVEATDATKMAGEPDPTFTAAVYGVVAPDTVAYSWYRQPGETPGTYEIRPYGADVQGNYEVSFTSATLSILAYDTQIKVDPISPVTYQGTQMKPPVSVTSAGIRLVEGTDYTVSYGQNLHAGTGSVTVMGKGAYAGKTTTASFTILEKEATVRAVDASKVAGTRDPELGWIASGLVGDDTVTAVTLTRQAGETAGTYPIRVTGAKVVAPDGSDVTGDYDLTYVGATFTITGSTPTPTPTPRPTPTPTPTPTPVGPVRPGPRPQPHVMPTIPTWSSWQWQYPYAFGYDGSHLDSRVRGWRGYDYGYGYGYRYHHDDGSSPIVTNDFTSTSSIAEGDRPRASRGGSTATTATTPSTPTTLPAVTSGKVRRHAGATRYDTMAAAVTAAFDHSDWVVVASGESYPDALGAVALAGAHDAPVILTAQGALSEQAASQIRRLGASHAIIVGGTDAVSEAVQASLEGMVTDVVRVSGADRTQTSVAVLKAVRDARGSSDTVVVASGTSFADALSAGPWAWRTSSPIVLTDARGMLTDEAVAAIKADGRLRLVLIVGGTSAVSDAIRDQLGDGFTYARKGGADRYDTSAQVADFATTNGLGWQRPTVATGVDFTDALSGAALAGKLGSPLLLVDASGTKGAAEVARHADAVSEVHVLGGTAAVSQAAADALDAALS